MDYGTLMRFIGKVEVQPDGCHYWTGKIGDNGYGYFWFEGKNRLAHRFIFEQFVGAIPAGEQLDHVCHTQSQDCPGGSACFHRRCVNFGPKHLEPVQGYENIMRSQGLAALNVAKNTCKAGHPLFGSNLYLYPSGERGCRVCRARWTKEWRDRRRTP